MSVDLTPPDYPRIQFSCPKSTAPFQRAVCSAIQDQISKCELDVRRIRELSVRNVVSASKGLRSRRSLTDFIGDIGNFFGLASSKQIRLLQQAVGHVSQSSKLNRDAIKKLAGSFLSFQQSSRQEMDSRDQMIRASFSKVTYLVSKLQTSLRKSDSRQVEAIRANQEAILILTRALPLLTRLSTQLHLTAAWYESFNSALGSSLHGELSPRLVPPDKLSLIIKAIEGSIATVHGDLSTLASRVPPSYRFSTIRCTPSVIPGTNSLLLTLLVKTIDLTPGPFHVWRIVSFGTPVERHSAASDPYIALLHSRAGEKQAMLEIDLPHSIIA